VAKANGEDITEEDEEEWYIRRIDTGLSVLQTVDYILAWIVMEDDGVSVHQ
jgi:beta-catenin-like protein 1